MVLLVNFENNYKIPGKDLEIKWHFKEEYSRIWD